VTIVPKGSGTRIDNINLSVRSLNLSCYLKINDENEIESVLINDRDVKFLLSGVTLNISAGSIFPELLVVRKKEEHLVFSYTVYRMFRDNIPEVIENFLRRHLSKQISSDKIYEIISNILQKNPASEREILSKSLKGTRSIESWKRFVEKMSSDDAAKRDFMNCIYLSILPEIMSRTTAVFKSAISQLLYIGPARARSDRYYRYQDLSVSEIDPDGKNFAMFLNSLNTSQVGSLSSWVKGLFGYGLSISRGQGEGHISINLTEEGFEFNIVDTGYGVSQIRPVLAQIWWARERNKNDVFADEDSSPTILAIEQPELHLHPAHQALLADAFVGEAASTNDDYRKNKVNFLVETHSEPLINRLGQLINSGRISAQDVHIVLFEPDPDLIQYTKTSIATFGPDGTLLNWPYGFFQPEVD